MSKPIYGSGFSTYTPPSKTIYWGGWGKEPRKYKSSLGYGESSFYDYSRESYYRKYSSTYTDPKDSEAVEKLLTSAYKSVREAVIILDFPFKVNICITANSFFSGRRKDGSRNIFLSTTCLNKSKKISDADKIDILCGSGIHEASHLKYTQLQVLNVFEESLKLTSNKKLILILSNFLEDERVEDKLLRERPGYQGYISKKKDYDFTTFPSLRSDNVLGEIMKYLRYKDKLKETSCINSYPELLEGIEKLLSENTLESTKDSCNLGHKLVDLIWKAGLPDWMFSEIESKRLSSFVEQVSSGFDESLPGTTTAVRELRARETDICGSRELNLFEDLGEGDKERFSGAIFEQIEPSKSLINQYKIIREEISKYVPALKKTLVSSYKNYDFTIPGCRSGLLDTNKLAEAYQGVPQVYCRQGHVRTNGTTICVLIDESGSMCSNVGFYSCTTKAEIARKTGILLNEAFGSTPGVDLFIYGHTADSLYAGATEIRVYKEPGAKYSPMSLASITAREENRDGSAILSVAKRVRKFTDQPCTLFIITDGAPSAHDYRGSRAVIDTTEKIKLVRSTMNMKIIGVCIDSVPEMDRMYGRGNYINLYSDISQFPSLLSKIIKNTIKENRETTIS